MTLLENGLRDYISDELLGDSMGSVEILLIREIGIPILLELARRRNADKGTQKALKDIRDDPEKALESLEPEVKGKVVNALADLLDTLIGGLFNDKTGSV